jgi:hypothetical protein
MAAGLRDVQRRIERLETLEAATAGVWALIEHKLLGSDVVSVAFESIPSTYRHLVLFSTVQQDSETLSNVPIHIRINADGSNAYLWDTIHSNASGGHPVTTVDDSSVADNNHWRYMFASNDSEFYAGRAITVFPHYKDTVWFKSMFSLAMNIPALTLEQVVGIFGCTWENTAAISEIDIGFFAPATINLKASSQFTLYGIS